MSHTPTGTGPLRDYHVVILGESGDPINSGNPLPVTATVTVTGTSAVADKSAFFESVTSTALISGAYDDTLGADPLEDSAVAIRSTVKRALHVNLRTAAGAELGLSTNPLPILLTDTADTPVKAGDATNNAMRVNIVAGSTNVGQADNSTFTQGVTTFVPVGGVFKDAGTDATDGKAASARITAKRALHVNLRDNSGVEVDPRQVRALTAADVITTSQGTSPWVVAGTLTPNNLAPAGNNVGVLSAVANVAAPTYIEGDQVLLSVDLTGALRTNANSSSPAIASNSPARNTEGSSVQLSTTLTGDLRVVDRKARKWLEQLSVQLGTNTQTLQKMAPDVHVLRRSWDAVNNCLAVGVKTALPTSDLRFSDRMWATGQTVTFNVNGCSTAVMRFSGTWTGTISLLADPGDGIFRTWYASNPAAQHYADNFTSQNVTWIVPVAGMKAIQLQSSGGWGGVAQVDMQACVGSMPFVPNVGYPPLSANTSQTDVGGFFQSTIYGTDGSQLLYRSLGLVRDSTGLRIVRIPDTFKSVQVTASGSTALWTPAAGKRFRLMKYMIVMTENTTLAAAAVLTISLLDSATNIAQDHDVWVPNAALGAAGDLYISPWIDLGNGIISSVVNNILNVNLSAVLATGNIRVICAGMEE